jgi:hypothetical protein
MPETCSFITESYWIISVSGWLFKNKSITMHGNMNVKKTCDSFHGNFRRSHAEDGSTSFYPASLLTKYSEVVKWRTM